METLFQSEHGPDNLLDILLLVECRYDHDTVASVHLSLQLLMQSYEFFIIYDEYVWENL